MTEIGLPHLCEKHRPRKGAGYHGSYRAVAQAVVANFLRRRDIVIECGGDPDEGVLARSKLVRSAIARHTPICCFIDQGDMKRILQRYAIPPRWKIMVLYWLGIPWEPPEFVERLK